ncbi:hypothetical protein [Brevibacillus daliensis]|uniref:hypothetical protein n=1 Tax=Brevibacillus daliensis TaxID=2892995 RepID=UPI001E5241BA|nr:hypothetical protein [Brevibacillus daliensis]
MNQTVKVSLWLGIIAFIVTFLAAVMQNLISVALIRAVIGFIFITIVAFLVQTVITFFTAQSPVKETEQEDEVVSDESTEETAPEKNDGLTEANDFIPIKPQNLENVENEHDPKLIAQTLRRFSDQ